MLGNWVEYAIGDGKRSIPMYVKAIFRDEVYLDFDGNEGDVWEEDAENLLGIPITEELLEKCGFDKHENWHSNDKKCFSNLEDDKIMYYEDCDSYLLVGSGVYFSFLHELQNAYYLLTKKHLEVKL